MVVTATSVGALEGRFGFGARSRVGSGSVRARREVRVWFGFNCESYTNQVRAQDVDEKEYNCRICGVGGLG